LEAICACAVPARLEVAVQDAAVGFNALSFARVTVEDEAASEAIVTETSILSLNPVRVTTLILFVAGDVNAAAAGHAATPFDRAMICVLAPALTAGLASRVGNVARRLLANAASHRAVPSDVANKRIMALAVWSIPVI
jgi:hypothetical protein